jgi:thiamine pyrophosphate-dependent acetolactate synthase large subunit-like protein
MPDSGAQSTVATASPTLQAHRPGLYAVRRVISPLLAAAKARSIRVVDTRDEATAVFAADAVARLTGQPGVAAVTAGPGLTNTITALKNAQLAQSPVVLFGGAAPTALQGRGALQDIDQHALVAPHVKLVRQVKRVRDLGPAMDEALTVAASGVPGPVFIECAVDLLYDEAVIRQYQHPKDEDELGPAEPVAVGRLQAVRFCRGRAGDP